MHIDLPEGNDMDPGFWHARWTMNQTGFHQPAINPYLERFWSSAVAVPGGRILVPLCGKSLDMHWLATQHSVAGIELSQLAVEAFFNEGGLHPKRSETPDHSCWSAAGIDIYCGDFFKLDTSVIGAVDGFYDRAALVALPHARRRAYVDHLISLLPTACNGLLVTLEYKQSEMDGPPFSVPHTEVESLFAANFSIVRLHEADVLDNYPGFREKGLSRLIEYVYLLKTHDATG